MHLIIAAVAGGCAMPSSQWGHGILVRKPLIIVILVAGTESSPKTLGETNLSSIWNYVFCLFGDDRAVELGSAKSCMPSYDVAEPLTVTSPSRTRTMPTVTAFLSL